MVRSIILWMVLPLAAAACTAGPKGTEAAVEVPVTPPSPPPPVESRTDAPVEVEEKIQGEFNPAKISQEVFQATMVDIKQLVEDLNRIIRAKDFNTWVSYLGKDYFAEISSAVFLRQISSHPRWKDQKPLADVRDYFLRVVVPSRDNDRVDDIEFVAARRVKAYTINARGQRLRLYELEDGGGGWKIVN